MDKDLRRLVIVGVALLVLLFVGRVLIESFLGDEGAVRDVTRYASSLTTGTASKRPPQKAMTAAVSLRDDLERQLDEIVPRIVYTQPPGFSVDGSTSADVRYIEVLRREQEALVNEARFVGKSVPLDLGMPVPNPTGLEDVLTALRALHVVHLVVSAAVQSDVDAVESIKVPTTRRRGQKDSGFLRSSPVEFELRGRAGAVRATLAAIGSGAVYLALDDVVLEAVDEDGDDLRCRFTAATLDVDPEVQLTQGRKG